MPLNVSSRLRRYEISTNQYYRFHILSMAAVDLFERLQRHPVLCSITLDGIVTFARLVGHIKRDILQPQPINDSDPNFAPDFLPDSVAAFLGTALGIPLDVMDQCWDIFSQYVWMMPCQPLTSEDYRLFKIYGWEHGLS